MNVPKTTHVFEELDGLSLKCVLCGKRFSLIFILGMERGKLKDYVCEGAK
jgi:hypothetical protein